MKLLFSALFAAGAAFAQAPFIDPGSVTMSYSPDDSCVTVSYVLCETNAIVTVDFQTNSSPAGAWCSIGAKNFRSVGGEVNKVVKRLGEPLNIVWWPQKDWPGHTVPTNGMRAVVRAWALQSPPDYMVVNLHGTGPACRRFYSCEDAIPDGIASIRYHSDELVMRRIPAAGVTWRMGVDSSDPQKLGAHEDPHYVQLSRDYYMGIFEFTGLQYWKAFNALYKSGNDDDKPLNSVSYIDLRGSEYLWPASGHNVSDWSIIGKLRTRTGIKSLDLPTEAQWEFACRAGASTPYYWGTDSSDATVGEYAWLNQNASWTKHVGGLKKPNAWGLYDMQGNVMEWCLDLFSAAIDQSATAANPEIDPVGATSGENRTKRGGCFAQATVCMRVTYRDNDPLAYSSVNEGFRVCCDADVSQLDVE